MRGQHCVVLSSATDRHSQENQIGIQHRVIEQQWKVVYIFWITINIPVFPIQFKQSTGCIWNVKKNGFFESMCFNLKRKFIYIASFLYNWMVTLYCMAFSFLTSIFSHVFIIYTSAWARCTTVQLSKCMSTKNYC